MTRVTAAICIVLSGIVFAGCVAPAPLSESMMFSEARVDEAADNSSAFGIQLSYAPRSSMSRQILEHDGRAVGSLDLANPNGLSIGLSGGRISSAEQFAWTFTVGIPLLGTDATIKLPGSNYITGVVGFGGQMLYVQHVVHDDEQLGIALGVGLQRTVYSFTSRDQWGFTPTIDYPSGSFGLRGVLLLRKEPGRPGGIKLVGSLGYVPQFHQALVGFSITTQNPRKSGQPANSRRQ